MTKIAFIGAGSTIFAKNVLGDCLMVPAVNGFEFALYDIDPKRLKESKDMLEHLKNRYNDTVSIRAYDDRKEALAGAKYVINAIQVGGYKPGTVIDFEIPKNTASSRRLPIRSESAGYSGRCGRFPFYWIWQKTSKARRPTPGS